MKASSSDGFNASAASCSHRYQGRRVVDVGAGINCSLLLRRAQQNPQDPSCLQSVLMKMEIPVAGPALAARSCPSHPSGHCGRILSVPVKLFCILRPWHLVSSERQRRALLLDLSLLENKVNLIVLEQMAAFHVVAFPWLNGAWLDINIKCSYMWIYKYSNEL